MARAGIQIFENICHNENPPDKVEKANAGAAVPSYHRRKGPKKRGKSRLMSYR